MMHIPVHIQYRTIPEMTFIKNTLTLITLFGAVIAAILGGIELYKMSTSKEPNIEIWANTAGSTAKLLCRDHHCGYETNISIVVINTGESDLHYRSLGVSEGMWMSETCFARVYVVGSDTEITIDDTIVDVGGTIPMSTTNKFIIKHFHRLDRIVFDQLFEELGPSSISLFKVNRALHKQTKKPSDIEIIGINQPFQKHEFFIVPLDDNKPEISGIYEMNSLVKTLVFKQSSKAKELRNCNWSDPVASK